MKFIRSNIGFILGLLFVLSLVLFPEFKAKVLQGFMKTGLYNPSVETAGLDSSSQDNASLPPMPDARFISAAGDTLVLNDTKGKVVFLNFWATWCPPCIAEMPSIQALKNKINNKDQVIFAMVDADADLPKSLSFMKKNKYQFQVYQQASALPESIFNGTLPTTLIINKKGGIVMKHEGLGNYDTPEMLNLLNSLSQ